MDDDLTTMLLQMSPLDQQVLADIIMGFMERKNTGETAALQAAIRAFWARMAEKQQIGNT
jgi:hypothetical protein